MGETRYRCKDFSRYCILRVCCVFLEYRSPRYKKMVTGDSPGFEVTGCCRVDTLEIF